MIGHIYFSKEGPEEFMTSEIGYIFNPAYKNGDKITKLAEEFFLSVHSIKKLYMTRGK